MKASVSATTHGSPESPGSNPALTFAPRPYCDISSGFTPTLNCSDFSDHTLISDTLLLPLSRPLLPLLHPLPLLRAVAVSPLDSVSSSPLTPDTLLYAGAAVALGGLGYYFFASDPSVKGKARELEGKAKELEGKAKGKVSP